MSYPAHITVTDTRPFQYPPFSGSQAAVDSMMSPPPSDTNVVPFKRTSSLPQPPDKEPVLTLEQRAQHILSKIRRCHGLLNDLISGPTAEVGDDCEPELVGVTTKLA